MDSLAYSFKLPQRSPNTMAQQRASEVVDQAAQQPSAQDMDLISPTKGLLQTGVDGEEAYYTAWQNMNNFAMEMAGKYGIDVTRPDPSSPEAIDAYRQFNRLYSTARQRGMQLRTGYETQEAINQAYLRGDIFLPSAAREGRITTSMDAMRVLPKQLEPQVEQYNTMLQGSNIVTQADLAEAQNLRQGLVDYYQSDYKNALINSGVDPNDADEYIQYQINALNAPMIDRYKAGSLSMKREELGLKRDKLRQDEGIDAAQQRLIALTDVIEKAKRGEQSEYLGAITGGKFAAAEIIDASPEGLLPKVSGGTFFERTREIAERTPQPRLRFTLKTGTVGGEMQRGKVLIDPYSTDALMKLNNVFNSASGQDNIPLEDLMNLQMGRGQQSAQQQQRVLSLSELKSTIDFSATGMTDDEIREYYQGQGFTITD